MPSPLLVALGWDAGREADLDRLAEGCPEPLVAGRVVRVDRGHVDVATADNPVRVATANPTEPLAVGDWLALTPTADRRWGIAGVLPRRSALRRAAASGESAAQVVAANVDVVLVAVPAVPEPKPAMVERMVALAWDAGATPVVVLTKADLVPYVDDLTAELAGYAPGADVVAVCATVTDGVAPLLDHLGAGTTGCLIGRSGAGKSTLTNALLGREHLATADIRADGKGRHTTTHRELVVLPSGGALIDTPGLRGVGLFLGDDGLDRAFADVEALAAGCRFADCAHVGEPGCAVLAAVEAGSLAPRRLESWRKLGREAEWIAARSDARLRAERSRRWRSVSLEMRRSGRARP